MNLFFDTSALIKFFHEEPGTTTVTEFVSNPENVIHVS
jgi:PIN domain nuclease of toxin-antitoxin system